MCLYDLEPAYLFEINRDSIMRKGLACGGKDHMKRAGGIGWWSSDALLSVKVAGHILTLQGTGLGFGTWMVSILTGLKFFCSSLSMAYSS